LRSALTFSINCASTARATETYQLIKSVSDTLIATL
jgi:hypothetical protein